MSTPLLCPTCLEADGLATIEQISGTAPLAIYRDDDGTLDQHWSGHTDVHWDSSKSVGISCECGYSYQGNDWATQLTPAPTLAQRVAVALQATPPASTPDFLRQASKVPAREAEGSAVRVLAEIVGAELGDNPLMEDIVDLVSEHRSTVENGVLSDPS